MSRIKFVGALRNFNGTDKFVDLLTSSMALSMAKYAELLLGLDAKYIAVSDKTIRASGNPILLTASKQAFANSKAFGLAKPISSDAEISSLRAINLGSSPPAIIRANQYTAASGSLPRIDLIKAEIIS